jgi:hypothetical protein
LSDSDVGRHLARVFYNCRSYRGKYQSSRQQYETNKSPESKRQLAVDLLQLQSCLSDHACPQRSRAFAMCWSSLPPELIQEFKREGMAHYLCMSERQAIERCVGGIVSQAVRHATAEDSEFQDDLMAIA